MTIQPQKVQYTYDNTTAKPTIQVWQYELQKVQYSYDNATARIKKHVRQYNRKKYNTRMII